MNKHILSAAAAAVLLSFSAASAVQAAQIYPVDQARFMTNARFDFKVELDTVVDRKNIQVQINGQDYKKVLKGDEIYVAEEIDAKGSAIILRDVEIKKPGKYTVTVKSPEGELRANWDIYTTPKKAVAKNVIILLATGFPSAIAPPPAFFRRALRTACTTPRSPWTTCRTWRFSARARSIRSRPTPPIRLRPT